MRASRCFASLRGCDFFENCHPERVAALGRESKGPYSAHNIVGTIGMLLMNGLCLRSNEVEPEGPRLFAKMFFAMYGLFLFLSGEDTLVVGFAGGN